MLLKYILVTHKNIWYILEYFQSGFTLSMFLKQAAQKLFNTAEESKQNPFPDGKLY